MRCATVNSRSIGFFELATASLALALIETGNSMLDWPPQIQTSPTSTFLKRIVFFPVITISNGPPGFELVESNHPLAVLCGRGHLLVLKPDRHLLAVIGRPPDGRLHPLLEHHPIGEEGVGLDLAQRA